MIVTNSDVRIIKGHGTPPDLEDGDIVFDLDGKVWTNDDDGNKIVVADKAGLTDPMVFAPTITVPPLEDTEATISITYLYYSQSGIPKNHVSTDWEVIKTSDNSVVFSSNTTGDNLTSVTITGLETDTEYKIRSKVNMETVSSGWGEVIVTTAVSFVPRFDLFNDGKTKALWLCENDGSDMGGVYDFTEMNGATYATISNKIAQDNVADDNTYFSADSPILDSDTPMTLSALIYPIRTDARIFIGTQGLRSSSEGSGYGFGYNYGATVATTDANTSDSNKAVLELGLVYAKSAGIAKRVYLPLNTWSHVLMTYDGNTFKVFLDGVKLSEDSYSNGFLSYYNFVSGYLQSYDSEYPLNGMGYYSDNIRLMDRGVTDDEALIIYNEDK